MLDSDIAIYVIKKRGADLQARFAGAAGQICMSAIAYAELMLGAEKSQNRDANLAVLDAFVAKLVVLPFTRDAALHYGAIRAALELAGTPCGANDMLIGAHARSEGLTLITNNRREFDRMPGLRVENWV